jgi:hypothetical protein
MRHIISNIPDVPVAPPLVDRRRGPADRRKEWRGGRRDSDWINRPPDGLAKLEAAERHPNALRRLVSSLVHMW